MKTKHTILLVCVGLILLFIVGLSFQKLILESGTPMTYVPQDNPPVLYNKEKTLQMHEIVNNRPLLSASDQAARQKLTEQQNPLQTTANFSIEYLSAPDEFLVEILTTDIDTAKSETVAWFLDQGVSAEGICSLPAVFYLNYDVAQSLRGSNIEFNPLPPGC